MKKILVLALLINSLYVHAQTQPSLYQQLSWAFGGLPIDKSTKKIIQYVEKGKNYTGHVHHNNGISYSGIVKEVNFFKLKPDTCFVDIESDMSDSSTNPKYFAKPGMYISACYKTKDSLFVSTEYARIIALMKPYFNSKNSAIIESQSVVSFFDQKKDFDLPLVIVYMSTECYYGTSCVTISFFGKND